MLVCFVDSGTLSEHGASCYAPSSSPSTGSPNSLPTAHILGLPTLLQTPEGSQQDSPDESLHLSHDDSPNSVTTGPNMAKKPLQPCTICASNPAKVCLQVHPFLYQFKWVQIMNAICSLYFNGLGC